MIFDWQQAQKQLAGKYPERETHSLLRILLNKYTTNSLPLPCLGHLSPEALKKIDYAIGELNKYRPIQYILGETEFYGLPIEVCPKVLIPRPETEELVDWIVRSYDPSTPLSIVDIGAGSGCIAIALKKNFPNATVWAIDVSEQALNVAKRNAAKNAVEINFLQKDALKNADMGFAEKSIDVVVSNPPYVTPSDKQQMSPNVLDYEPHIALFVPEDDPLVFYKSIANFAKKCLKKGGKIFFEINRRYPEEISNILHKAGFDDVTPRKDLNENWRMVAGCIE